MATDTALLEGLRAGTSPPTLRFYTWDPPSLSLGFHQALEPAWQHLPWVRRPTGGRAVWHAGELSYALTVRGFEGSTLAVYARLCAFLVRGFGELGIELAYGRGGRDYVRNSGCFTSATSADLVYQERKLIGSAQVRRGAVRLQHGSIQVTPDRAGLKALFPDQSPEAVIGLAEIDSALTIERVVAVLARACSESLETPVVAGDLSGAEQQAIARLCAEAS